MRAIARELRGMDRAMKRRFTRKLSLAVEPLRRDLPASALAMLPRRGGLAERVSKAKIRVNRKASGAVRVTASQQYQIQRMDDPGVVRHPVFKRKGEEGRRTVWLTQRIQPKWFTRPAEALRPDLQQAMLKACEEIGRDIEHARGTGGSA
jgi:hypothetical protein